MSIIVKFAGPAPLSLSVQGVSLEPLKEPSDEGDFSSLFVVFLFLLGFWRSLCERRVCVCGDKKANGRLDRQGKARASCL